MEALKQLRVATIPNIARGFSTSALSASEVRIAILEGFKTILDDRIKTFFPGFRLVAASFVMKKAGTGEGRCGLHQDSSLVDHRKHRGINVWVPLCDVDDQNGCLRVASRSQRFNRIGSLPPIAGPHASFERNLVHPSVTSLRMKAGESCVFDSRLLHASEENHSDVDRVAAFFSLIPEDQPIRLYFRNPVVSDQLDVFQVEDAFLLHFDPLEYPNAAQQESMVMAGSFSHVQRKLLATDFAALHGGAAVKSRSALAVIPSVTVSLDTRAQPDSASYASSWRSFWRRFR